MGRLPRMIADGLVYHALNRGNNRAPVFFQARDYRTLLFALGQTKARFPFRLFAYCLMTNHFYLVLAAEPGQEISRSHDRHGGGAGMVRLARSKTTEADPANLA